jgi:hypothetical protein
MMAGMEGFPTKDNISGNIMLTMSVMKKTVTAAKYFPSTIAVRDSGDVSSSWSVLFLRSHRQQRNRDEDQKLEQNMSQYRHKIGRALPEINQHEEQPGHQHEDSYEDIT